MIMPAGYGMPTATISGVPGGTSRNGRWLVVEAFDPASGTHMLLIDTNTSTVVHRVNLAGRFQFDAVSNDGMRLYLIQFLNGKEYYVRLDDLVGGALTDNIVVDKSNGEPSMTAVRLSRVASHDGSERVTMHARENEGPDIR